MLLCSNLVLDEMNSIAHNSYIPSTKELGVYIDFSFNHIFEPKLLLRVAVQ